MKDSRSAVAWQKWSDVQLGDWRDVSHSESFYAGYEAAEDELAHLREKLAAVEKAVISDVRRRVLSPNHILAEVLAIIDGKATE